MKSAISFSKNAKAKALLAAALIGVFAGNASAQIIVNGGFETGSPGYGGVNTVVNTAIVSGWTVITLSGTGEISITKPSVSLPTGQETGYPAAAEGLQYLGLNTRDTPAGTVTIYQDFTTTLSASYQVTFSVGASSSGTNQPVSIKADTFNVISGSTSGGVLGTLTSGGTASGSGGTFFAPTSFTFVATGTTSRLVFTDMTVSTTNVDALLDGISVSAIPEPSTYAALAGAAMLGITVWTRRIKSSRNISRIG